MEIAKKGDSPWAGTRGPGPTALQKIWAKNPKNPRILNPYLVFQT